MHSSYCGQNYIYIELAKCDQTQLACLCIGREKEREGEREREGWRERERGGGVPLYNNILTSDEKYLAIAASLI